MVWGSDAMHTAMSKPSAGVLPQMELGVFEGVARVMTAKELQAFKAAFEAADRRANMPSPQLASGGEKKSNNQAFVI